MNRHFSRWLLALALLLAAGSAAAAPVAAAPVAAASTAAAVTGAQPHASLDQVVQLGRTVGAGKFLPADRAFRLSAAPDGPDRIRLSWQIAPGYYLYRSSLKAQGTSFVRLGTLAVPQGEIRTDPWLGTQQIYHRELVATLPIERPGSAAPLSVPLRVTYRGCADAGLCYPPIHRTVTVSLPPGASTLGSGTAAGGTAIGGIAATSTAVGAAGGSAAAARAATALGASGNAAAGAAASTATGATAAASITAAASAPGFVSEQDRYASVVRNGSLLAIIAFFYAAGLVLAFTPCVLPMVPIVSGIVIGGGRRASAGRGFALSLTYVIGMALTYTAAGIAAAAGGEHVQAAFQQPWIVGAFAAVFVLLALAMFGTFTLQMPSAIQTRLAAMSDRQAAGTFGGVLVMGALSALIVTTCVAPALVGALLVIGQSGDMVRGGMALFVMGLGMGTPLVAVGASAGRLLPKAGPWMDLVKQLFGALMLAVAVWMLVRIVPSRFDLILWAVPVLAGAVVIWRGSRSLRAGKLPVRLGAAAAGLYGLALVVGAALGGVNPLEPVPQLEAPRHSLTFRRIGSVTALEAAVAEAHAAGRPVMLDFTAAWCVSCQEMAATTFMDPSVQAALRGAVLLEADVTRDDRDDQALLAHFGIFGPPTIAFYGPDGKERRSLRVVGYMKPAQFASVVARAMAPALASTSLPPSRTP